MNTILVLQNRAIKAAQAERWADAQQHNLEILDQDPQNVSALNRLGFAYMQDKKNMDAQATYERVLQLDRANVVAKKYLQAIKSNAPTRLPKALSHSDFIDEPGKTKSVQLVRLAGNDVLRQLSVGSECVFNCAKTRVSVYCEQDYIGTLPDDLCSRLRPFLEAGNCYTIRIQSLKNNTVTVFIREVSRAECLQGQPSFPSDHLGTSLAMERAASLARRNEIEDGEASPEDAEALLQELEGNLDDDGEVEETDFLDITDSDEKA
jgi:hypothetical protein